MPEYYCNQNFTAFFAEGDLSLLCSVIDQFETVSALSGLFWKDGNPFLAFNGIHIQLTFIVKCILFDGQLH